jgi:N-dimethylarginine dimethylaminohydrolase
MGDFQSNTATIGNRFKEWDSPNNQGAKQPAASVISVHNEWDPLEEIVVGIADDAHFPVDDISFALSIDPRSGRPDFQFTALKLGSLSRQVVEETNEDLEQLVDALENEGVVVRRPKPHPSRNRIVTPFWETDVFFAYCPRDIMLAVGDTIIETPCMQRSRYFESFCYEDIYVDYTMQGARWISAPKPKLRGDDFNLCGTQEHVLKNREPIFEAANVIRAGRDLFYLVSDGANELGARWLQNTLGAGYRVHLCKDLYSGLHIDSTIALLKPGLFLANPERVSKHNVPEPLRKWEMIFAPEMEDWQQSDSGYVSSVWIGMNLLMVNPGLAVVDAKQVALIALLEKHDIDVIPLTLRHGRTLGGGFHCVTLDVRRTGNKEDYFNGE